MGGLITLITEPSRDAARVLVGPWPVGPCDPEPLQREPVLAAAAPPADGAIESELRP